MNGSKWWFFSFFVGIENDQPANRELTFWKSGFSKL